MDELDCRAGISVCKVTLSALLSFHSKGILGGLIKNNKRHELKIGLFQDISATYIEYTEKLCFYGSARVPVIEYLNVACYFVLKYNNINILPLMH